MSLVSSSSKYVENRDRIIEYQKGVYKANRESKLAYQREYNETHRNKVKEYNKQYYTQHRSELLEKMGGSVTCTCGKEIRRCNFAAHKKTKLHAKRMIEQKIDKIPVEF